MKSRRIGRFSIADECIDEHSDDLKKILSEVLILRAEHMIASQCLEYVAIGDVFDEIPEGEPAPEYTLEHTKHIDDLATGKTSYTHKWVRL